MATATPFKTTDSGTPAAKAPKAPPLGRAMVWVGLAAGTAITVLAVMHGIRIPGLEVVLSVLATWVLLMVLAVTVAELTRRHHRAVAGHGWRHGKRGARFAGHHTGRAAKFTGHQTHRGASWLWGQLASKAATRWGSREHRPLMFTRASGPRPEPDGPFTPVLLTARSTSGRVLNPVTGEPHATVLVKDPEDLKRRLAAVARYPDIEVSTRPADPPGGNESNPPEGTPTMADTTVTDDSTKGWDDPLPGPGKARTRRPTGVSYSAAWKQVVSDTSEFEPEDDGHLLAWMAAEVNGMSAYAEAMTEVYETCVSTVGLDPVAMKATHDVADAAADAASAMAAARAKFASHYSEVREFAANGGLLPFDGRWITGDGDA